MVPPASVRPTRNPAGAVHGTVLAGALIAVQGAQDRPDISHLVTLVLITQVIYWLAHVYAELVGERITAGTRTQEGQLSGLLHQEWPLVAVSFGPLAVIVICSGLGVSANSAVLAGLSATVAMMAGWALFAGYRSGLQKAEMLLYVAASVLLGLALIATKALLH